MSTPVQSRVTAVAAANPQTAYQHFCHKLNVETDPSDVYSDMRDGIADFVLIDVRSPENYARSHAQGAINIPHVDMTAERMASYAKDTLFVVYCWGPGCNGATKAGMKLASLGFAVKEMIGGIEYWEDRERYPIVRGG